MRTKTQGAGSGNCHGKIGIQVAILIPAVTLLASTILCKSLNSSTPLKSGEASFEKSAVKERLVSNYGKLPLSFEANSGQTDQQVKFLSRANGYTLFLTPTESVLALKGSRGQGPGAGVSNVEVRTSNIGKNKKTNKSPQLPTPDSELPTVLRMQLIGANPDPEITGQDELPGKSNYFIGNDPAKWSTNVSHYAKVRYHNVYPGVDLVYYGNQRRLEHDFVVAPGKDPETIRLRFEGSEKIKIDKTGDLILSTLEGEIRQKKPICYQIIGAVKKMIEGSYVLRGKNEIGFKLASYDLSRPLVIDPVLVDYYSTYLGGMSADEGRDIAVDSSGNAYVVGWTESTNFPGTMGSQIQAKNAGIWDVFVTKINSQGTALIYSTYLGGKGDDYGNGIAVDSSGNAYVTGFTDSPDFPGTMGSKIQAKKVGIQSDVFVVKINSQGTALIYSTYLGGKGDDYGNGIAVDSSGNAYVTGYTFSPDFPGTMGSKIQPKAGSFFDAFVTKINSDGTALIYSTYLGGGSDEWGSNIAVDSLGDAYVVGWTESSDFPGTMGSKIQALYGGGFRDAFVTKINSQGTALIYSTYLGGENTDDGQGIAVDSSSNAYVTGRTESSDFPGTMGSKIQEKNRGSYDAFVTRINSQGTALIYSTYLGGKNDDEGNDIAVDFLGYAHVTGWTASPDFPGITGGQIEEAKFSSDVFVTRVNLQGTALNSILLGGRDRIIKEKGNGIAVNPLPGFAAAFSPTVNAYVTGWTESSDFPGTPTSKIQSQYGGTQDAFVVKIGCGGITLLPKELPNGILFAVYREKITANGGTAPYTFSLVGMGSLPPGLTLLSDGTIIGIPTKAGNFAFAVMATDAEGCTGVQVYELRID